METLGEIIHRISQEHAEELGIPFQERPKEIKGMENIRRNKDLLDKMSDTFHLYNV